MSAERRLKAVPTRKPTYRVADPAEVERECRDWSDEFLECRTYNHNWLPQRATWNAEYAYYHIVQVCRRCKSERRMDMNRRGHLLAKPTISYSEGYLSKGLGRLMGDSRDIIRLAAVTRTFPLERVTGKKARESLPTSKTAREALEKEREVG